MEKSLPPDQVKQLLQLLRTRFENNTNRHNGILWEDVEAHICDRPQKLWSLQRMEDTGGEPDVVGRDTGTGEYIFFDCSVETPAGRRSLCYDREALDARKEAKPADSAVDMAATIGIDILNEQQYRELQELGNFDIKTSSWLKTPSTIRSMGGAIFGDKRYNHVFIYHNGAQSYYAARGFRGCLKI